MDTTEKVYLTLEGLKNLKEEYDKLVNVERPESVKMIELALNDGGSDDNAQYEIAIERSLALERKIADIEETLKKAILIDEGVARSEVGLGSKVTIEQDGKTTKYTIVGSAEANPQEGRISNESPLGKKLLGRKKGQLVEIRESEITYKVVDID
ncbi:transcription elongation factor GreA [candidate division WWE3 bacterium CG_4_10_14_0_2_um_filter_42_7]|uniref:Transcription elongation factor GreA n=2 Tax=Katanobacteria TaxID=422282 RepID=A0A2H0X904_UNCKA|nr:MAG: transcription elongation factor GreA [candidate division WWE3 bacterium CG08_land_8_20_14_0_20_41_15]PIZ43702.1 MAG: transcription elongation factor GreA [candidate division WWE3 bacterium CG_4_10_14_0_2_um_filter_42_7]